MPLQIQYHTISNFPFLPLRSLKLLMKIPVLYCHLELYNSCLTIYKDKVSHNTRCNRVQVPQQTKPAAGGRKTTVHFFLFSNYIRSSVA